MEIEEEVRVGNLGDYVPDEDKSDSHNQLVDYKVAIRNDVHAVQTCLDRLQKSLNTEQMRKELITAQKAIEQMLEALEE